MAFNTRYKKYSHGKDYSEQQPEHHCRTFYVELINYLVFLQQKGGSFI